MICRSKIQTGDALSFGGRGLISAIIRRVTGGKAVHTGIALRRGEEIYVVDVSGFREPALDCNPLDDVLISYRRELRGVYRHILMGTEERRRMQLALGRIVENNKIEYDYRGAVSFWIPWFGDSEEKLYCSEFFCETLDKIGLPLQDDLSPAGIEKSMYLEQIS